MKLLEINNLGKSFGENEVLKDITMSVEKGEVVAIIGPSGSGKSTLLRCATLLETMDKGSLKIGGRLVASDTNGRSEYVSKNELRQIKSLFGLVFQQFNLFPHYTVLKNVMDAPVVVEKRDKADVEKEARELLLKVGLEGKENSYPCHLSGGQQQRVAIARALAKNPKLLLCDEPTGALDYNTGKAVLKLLQDTCRNTGTTVIVITHNQALTAMADRVITVKSGTVEKVVMNDNIRNVEDLEW